MKARQLFFASLGLAMLALVVWMILVDNKNAAQPLASSVIVEDETQQKPNIDENKRRRDTKPQPSPKTELLSHKDQAGAKSKAIEKGKKPKINSAPVDIPTEEFIKKNRVLLEKIKKNYDRILRNKQGGYR